MEGKDPINSVLAIDALRKQGFSTISAICEIIDNSIQANATNIKITLDYKQKESGQQHSRIQQITFVDNGDGMDSKILHNCLILGESTRRANNNGIGKFGVGATFSGISQGKHIDIFSKIRGGRWMYTCLDLDSLSEGKGILEPISEEPPVDNDMQHGTIIVWRKIDNGSFTENNEENLYNDVGRIYRKFLTAKKIKDGKIIDNNPIKITINGKDIQPYDPLFATYNRKKDDTDEPEVHHLQVPIGKGKSRSHMWITTSYLPEPWWIDEGSGNKSVNTKERYIGSRNEGISIVREDREVLFGDIPYFKLHATKKKFIEIDRWTGIEVSFERDADDLFEVQNNKSRLIISTEMRDVIAENISSTIDTRRSNIDKIRKKSKSKEGKSRSDNTDLGTTAIQDGINTPTYNTTEQQSLREISDRLADTAEESSQILKDLLRGYHLKSTYDLDPKGPFVSYDYHLNSLRVTYNMSHPFMKAFIEILDSIAKLSNVDPADSLTVQENRRLRVLFDILMASFGQAKKALGDPTISQEIDYTFNSLITNWGDLSQRYTTKYQNDS